MIWVVLGMHKSGTTLVSRILHESGINMTEELSTVASYDKGNKMERVSTKEVNHVILQSQELFSLDVGSSTTRRFGETEQVRMRTVIDNCNQAYLDWGFKDPRTCLTYDLWQSMLPVHRLVVVFRSPEEVWSHYWSGARRKRKRVVFLQYFNRWCEHNISILKYLKQGKAPFIVLNYSDLMTDPDEFRRLGDFVGKKLVDCRQENMYRSKSSPGIIFFLAKILHRFRGGADPDKILMEMESMEMENT